MSEVIKPVKKIFGQERVTDRPSGFDPQTKDLTSLIMQRAKGESPSLAETQTKNMLDTNLENTISAINSAPGVSPALKAMMITRAGERTGSEVVKQGSEARIAEQIGAERTLGNILIGGRGQDMSAFEQEQERRAKFAKDLAKAGGQALGVGATG